MESKNTKYLVLTIVLLILSVFGIFLIFKINNSPVSTQNKPETQDLISKISITPTSKPIVTITPIATITGKIASPSPTKKPTITKTPTATPTAKITPTTIITPSPIPTESVSGQINYKNQEDGFSIEYSSTRKFYQDKESSGNRYTFYSLSGNFAVHVALSGSWAWTNSDRNFSSSFIVSGQNTFRYEIATQTIVDLQSSDKNYTIQCVHNGKESLKTECEAFIKSFQLL
ncbi:MAG: hypothetical protein PHO75_00110 [Candidatus Shapirobacteria bacterium]|jgi:hypothetical protein|nr:hypothetical protein [Candidatus Shapirobacteria bacterium]